MRWYALISLLTDERIRFLIGFVIVAIIFAIILILVEMNLKEKSLREKEKFKLRPADRIKIFIRSDKSLADKLEFLDKMAKEYFNLVYGFPMTSSYSYLVNELKKKGNQNEIDFCKNMFFIFYSKEGASEEKIMLLGKLLMKLEIDKSISDKEAERVALKKKELEERKEKESKKLVDKKSDKKLEEVKRVPKEEVVVTKNSEKSKEKKKSSLSFFKRPNKLEERGNSAFEKQVKNVVLEQGPISEAPKKSEKKLEQVKEKSRRGGFDFKDRESDLEKRERALLKKQKKLEKEEKKKAALLEKEEKRRIALEEKEKQRKEKELELKNRALKRKENFQKVKEEKNELEKKEIFEKREESLKKKESSLKKNKKELYNKELKMIEESKKKELGEISEESGGIATRLVRKEKARLESEMF